MIKLSNNMFCLADNDLWDVRKSIYHSSGDGYYLFRDFISQNLVQHLLNYWTKLVEPSTSHSSFPGKVKAFYPGCPCYYSINNENGNKVFYNPLWSNKNIDIVSNEIAASITHLRSQIEGKAFTRDCMPSVGQRCTIPRIIVTKNGENILAPHTDYGFEEPNPKNIDFARVQATLFLSRFGVDYSGSGFELTKNNGTKIQCEKDLQINPGDLLIWRYNNIHEISSIKSSEDQTGFVRMLFPLEIITDDRIMPSMVNNLLGSIKKRIFK